MKKLIIIFSILFIFLTVANADQNTFDQFGSSQGITGSNGVIHDQYDGTRGQVGR